MKNIAFSYFVLITGVLITTFFSTCKEERVLKGESYDPPGSTDTRDKVITPQKKQTFAFGNVFFSNELKGGRLVEVFPKGTGYFVGVIAPENAPINNSAWYAFKIWSDIEQDIVLEMNYRDGEHRYYPKLSKNRRDWLPIHASHYRVLDTNAVELRLSISTDTLWVSGQELSTSSEVKAWAGRLAQKHGAFVQVGRFGESKQGRELPMVEIGSNPQSRRYMVALGRQHPPEVSGQVALEAFVEAVCAETDLGRRFRAEFTTLVFPLMNPDGTDNGHWRHNAGGVDLNRDWVHFNQPETSQLKRYLKKRVGKKGEVAFGFDFHGTQADVIYTILDSIVPRKGSLVQPWLDGCRAALPSDKWTEEAFDVTAPIAKNWLYHTFGTEAVTYEVGDESPRPLIRQKARIAAENMMRLLLETKPKKEGN